MIVLRYKIFTVQDSETYINIHWSKQKQIIDQNVLLVIKPRFKEYSKKDNVLFVMFR